MTPSVITGEIFKNRSELPQEIFKDLIVAGGVEKVKELLTEKWKQVPTDIIAVPSLTVNSEGRLGGAKWYVTGQLPKDINLKLSQLNSEADDDVYICIKNVDLSMFTFYNKRRNVSGWIDSDELDITMFRKAKSMKQPITADQFSTMGMKGFCVRLCVMPTSTTTANMTLALHPMSKEELKAKAPDNYHKNCCPQVALPIGENNAKFLTIKLGIEESIHAKVGMGILPVIEDLRSEEEVASVSPSSLQIRKALHNFLRSVRGLNNKTAKKVMEAMEDMATEAGRSFDPDYIWPEAVTEESDEPVDELGELHEYYVRNVITRSGLSMRRDGFIELVKVNHE